MSSDNVALAFNYIDARIARFRQYLETIIEKNVKVLENAVGNRTLTDAVAECVQRTEKKNFDHINKITVDYVRNLEDEVIKTFQLPDDRSTRVNLRTYTHERINA
jgi:hypothetical protein